MNKKQVILIAIIILILVSVASIVTYFWLKEQGKNYEIEEIKEYNYFILKQNDLFGVIDKQGNTIIEPIYSEIKIPNPEKAVFVCYQGERTKVFNDKN